MSYIGLHNHSEHSNYRLRDSINTIQGMFEYTRQLGHKGIAITEHETVGSSIEAIKTLEKLRQENPEMWKDYKLILGNEIYLCSKKAIENKDYAFNHFILLAKDEIGHQQIKQLSTIAWMQSFVYVMRRCPTYYEDIINVIGSNPGHVIGMTGCLGGALPRQIIKLYEEQGEKADYSNCIKWIEQMKKIFGENNFYLEMQPSNNPQQILVNNVLYNLSLQTFTDYVITTDSHYERQEDRKIHELYLKSQDGDREVSDFYETTYIMSEQEIHNYMDETLGHDKVQQGLDNTMKIFHKCKEYDLRKPLSIPYIPANLEEPNKKLYEKYKDCIPLLQYFYESEYDSDRHLIRDILTKIETDEQYRNQRTYEAIQECLEALKISSEKMNTRWSAYLLQTANLVQTVWESGSLVMPGRGSGVGFLLLNMLGITQINPLRESTKTYAWRFLNPERVSVLDIDIDSMGSKRDDIVEALKNKYGANHISKVQTLLREKSRSALQTAVRGCGLNSDIGIFLASFIKSERGIQYSLKQTFYGDEKEGIAPDREFVRLMTEEYPQVWEVAQKIEGLICGVGSHAGGIILTEHEFYESTGLMKTNNGDIITQFNLHDAEDVGLIKWDLLSIDASDRIYQCLQLLLKDGLIKDQGGLKQTYEHYLGIYKIERKAPKMWKMIWDRKILSLFQMEKQSGIQAIDLVKPTSVDDLAIINSVMRLMASDENSEPPLEKFARFKNDISLWYKEMDDYGLTKQEQKLLEPILQSSYGICESQEKMMSLVQIKEVGGYSLLWSDKLRKSVAKKSPKDFDSLQAEFFDNVDKKHLSKNLCNYVWNVLIKMSRGYSFNASHTLAYSLIGLQEMNLAYEYPIIYWNTANLIVDSGGENGNVNYGKIAQAIGNIRKAGIKVSLADINRSDYSFVPDVENNQILYGLKGLCGIGDTLAKTIIDYRPYTSLDNFIEKMEHYKSLSKDNKMGNSAVIALIKAGCFDKLENKNRIEIMKNFIKKISNPKKSLSYDDIEILNNLGVLTQEQQKYELRLYRFKKYVTDKKFFVYQEGKSANTAFYRLEQNYAEPFFFENFETNMIEDKDYKYDEQGNIIVKRGSLDREFKKLLQPFKTKVLDNPNNLQIINEQRFQDLWDTLIDGGIPKWEMDSLSFYYTKHELADIDFDKYLISDFDELPESPEVAEYRNFKGKEIPRFKLTRICGTVIDKDKTKHMITLLTPTGVVKIKFYKGQFGFYDKQISEINEDGSKTVLEKSWFTRGTKLLVTGYRRDEQFVPKKYKDSVYKHSLQLIREINGKDIKLQNTRIGEENDEFYT